MGRRIVTTKQLNASSVSSDNDTTESTLVETPSLQTTTAVETSAPSSTATVTTADTDDYISRLIKYIPTEIVTLYLLVDGILKSFTSSPLVNWIIFFLLLALTPFYIWRMTRETSKTTAWDQIIVSFVSFTLWVYVIGGPFASLSWYAPQYGSIFMAIFTVFVPLIRK